MHDTTTEWINYHHFRDSKAPLVTNYDLRINSATDLIFLQIWFELVRPMQKCWSSTMTVDSVLRALSLIKDVPCII